MGKCKFIDFFINGQCTENRLRSQRIPTQCKIKVKNCKLIDLVIIIEVSWAMLMPRFSNFLSNSIIHFQMFLYLVTCFLKDGFVAMPVTNSIKDHVPVYPYLISKGSRNCSTLWPAHQRNRDSSQFLKKLRIVEFKLTPMKKHDRKRGGTIESARPMLWLVVSVASWAAFATVVDLETRIFNMGSTHNNVKINWL